MLARAGVPRTPVSAGWASFSLPDPSRRTTMKYPAVVVSHDRPGCTRHSRRTRTPCRRPPIITSGSTSSCRRPATTPSISMGVPSSKRSQVATTTRSNGGKRDLLQRGEGRCSTSISRLPRHLAQPEYHSGRPVSHSRRRAISDPANASSCRGVLRVTAGDPHALTARTVARPSPGAPGHDAFTFSGTYCTGRGPRRHLQGEWGSAAPSSAR